MHRSFSKFAIVGAAFVVLVGLTILVPGQPASKLRVQPASPHRVGVVDDWSFHHLVFSDPGTYEQAVANGTYSKWLSIQYDTRYIMQQMKRNPMQRALGPAPGFATLAGRLSAPIADWWPIRRPPPPRPPMPTPLKSDWSESMVSTSATVGIDNYPAKYNWTAATPTAANCAGGGATDYVVYNTSLTGSSSQASIIAYDNLYATTCSGTVPQTYWAYDTGGTIETSVALSEDGTQVAFIHSASTASLVLLKWSATGGAFTGTTTAGSASVTSVSISCSLLLAGEPIYGPTIPSGDKVSSCSGTTLTLTTGTGVTAGTTQPLTYNNQFTGTLTASSTSVTVPSGTCSVTNIVGSPIYGTGIPQGDTVASCSGTTLGLTTAATSSGSQTLTFNPATAAAPVVLTTANSLANYRACVAPCMTTIAFSTSKNDTISSPFADYTGDNIYVGDASGNLLQFKGVFKGTPAAGFAVAAGNTSGPLTSAVFDPVSQLAYVTNYNSSLAEVTPTGTVTFSAGFQSGATADVREGPLVDSNAGKVYVFEEGPSSHNFIDQLPTNFPANATAAVVDFGTGGSHILYSGNFDNAYYTSSNGTGNLYVCGNTGGSATLYQIPITSGTMGAANTGPTVSSSSTTCSPVSEVYNSNATNGPYDWIYAGVENHCSATGGGSSGCVMSLIVTAWQASHAYLQNQEILDSNLNIQKVTSAGGTSGATEPTKATWKTTSGQTTTDGSVTWTCEGTMLANSVGTAYDGGTSGIVIDNISTATGASNIYFSTLGTGSTGSCATTPSTYGGCAIQASQSAP